jgi:proline racemase
MPDAVSLPLPALHDWALPSHGLKVETIDAHAGGQSLRVILKGIPPLKGRTMLECQDYARKHFDHLRRSLLFEPRGHADLYGCLLTPPVTSGSHFGALFLHRGGFIPMCGHGVIALATVLLECGLVDLKGPETLLRIDTPAGRIRAYGEVGGGQVERVFYEFGAARVVQTGLKVEVPGWGEVRCDLAWAGALFAFVDASALGLSTAAAASGRLAEAGTAIRIALQAVGPGPSGHGEAVDEIFFTDRPLKRRKGGADARQVGVFADGGLDRSPGGMGICARLALMSGRGEIGDGTGLTVEGITGSTFRGRIVSRQPEEGGVICEIEGQAWITGQHTFLIAADDPFRGGFLL